MMDMADVPTRPTTKPPPVCSGQPSATRAWNYDGPALSEESDFTRYERDALRRLHAAGWNGNNVNIVIMDHFHEDGRPSHGTGVANMVRRHAPNANYFYTGMTADTFSLEVDFTKFHVMSRSFAVPAHRDTEDRLEVPQSRAGRDDSTNRVSEGMSVYGAGNADAPLPDGDLRRAVPVIKVNEFVRILGNPKNPEIKAGYLHAKSAILVVGAVDYRAGGCVLSHGLDGAELPTGWRGPARLHRRAGRQPRAQLRGHLMGRAARDWCDRDSAPEVPAAVPSSSATSCSGRRATSVPRGRRDLWLRAGGRGERDGDDGSSW